MTGHELLEILKMPDWRERLALLAKDHLSEIAEAEEKLPFEEYVSIPDWQSRESYLSALSGKWGWEKMLRPYPRD